MGCSKLAKLHMYQTVVGAFFVLFFLGIIAGIITMVHFGFIMGNVGDEQKAWDDGRFDEWIAQTHEELKAENTLINQWNEARFDYYARDLYPQNAAGTNLFERRYEDHPERVAQIEELLGCDFSDPNSWNQTAVDQRAQELEDALRNHEAEYDISEEKLYDSQADSVQPKSEWTRDDDLKAYRDYVDAQPKEDKFPTLTPRRWAEPNPKMPAHHARAGNDVFMGVTIPTAVGTGIAALILDPNDKERKQKPLLHRLRTPCNVVALLMVIIAMVALAIGVHGMSGNFEERNSFFLQVTKYFMFILPSMILLVSLGGLAGETCLAKSPPKNKPTVTQTKSRIEKGAGSPPKNQPIVTQQTKSRIEKGMGAIDLDGRPSYSPRDDRIIRAPLTALESQFLKRAQNENDVSWLKHELLRLEKSLPALRNGHEGRDFYRVEDATRDRIDEIKTDIQFLTENQLEVLDKDRRKWLLHSDVHLTTRK